MYVLLRVCTNALVLRVLSTFTYLSLPAMLSQCVIQSKYAQSTLKSSCSVLATYVLSSAHAQHRLIPAWGEVGEMKMKEAIAPQKHIIHWRWGKCLCLFARGQMPADTCLLDNCLPPLMLVSHNACGINACAKLLVPKLLV